MKNIIEKVKNWFSNNKTWIKEGVIGFWDGWCLGCGVIMLIATICSFFVGRKAEK